MNQRIESIDAIKTIDRVLHSTKSAVSYSGERIIEPVKVVEKTHTTNDRGSYLADKKQVQEWVDEAQSVLQRVNSQLSFKLHEGTGRTLVQIVEVGTDKVIREIPPEKMLDVIAGIWKWAGVVVDRTE